jgi:hypothetical protein
MDRRRQAWHDKLADTFVVYGWDVEKFNAQLNAMPKPQGQNIDATK